MDFYWVKNVLINVVIKISCCRGKWGHKTQSPNYLYFISYIMLNKLKKALDIELPMSFAFSLYYKLEGPFINADKRIYVN